jgi:hypothetical protein
MSRTASTSPNDLLIASTMTLLSPMALSPLR